MPPDPLLAMSIATFSAWVYIGILMAILHNKLLQMHQTLRRNFKGICIVISPMGCVTCRKS
ncbi:hypothetical protein NECAME_07478 [Necator americanus]|uniref:Uncharacterized protein n=1 Tax=Necator americanus TaxID=51031 RepID=W2TQC7_NECAM|nr:hypothetical protein NECAME_07478 [Necator americanus]ETN83242.1 hypothetical protein NECAME_07478 [Necator americanus]